MGEFASGGQIEVSLEFSERVKATAFEGGGEVLVLFEIDAEPMWQGGLEAAFDDGVESDLLSSVRLGVGAGGDDAIERADFKNSGIGDAVAADETEIVQAHGKISGQWDGDFGSGFDLDESIPNHNGVRAIEICATQVELHGGVWFASEREDAGECRGGEGGLGEG